MAYRPAEENIFAPLDLILKGESIEKRINQKLDLLALLCLKKKHKTFRT